MGKKENMEERRALRKKTRNLKVKNERVKKELHLTSPSTPTPSLTPFPFPYSTHLPLHSSHFSCPELFHPHLSTFFPGQYSTTLSSTHQRQLSLDSFYKYLPHQPHSLSPSHFHYSPLVYLLSSTTLSLASPSLSLSLLSCSFPLDIGSPSINLFPVMSSAVFHFFCLLPSKFHVGQRENRHCKRRESRTDILDYFFIYI